MKAYDVFVETVEECL